MTYKFIKLELLKPDEVINELNKAGLTGYKPVFFQPVQKIKPGIQINGIPQIELLYDIILQADEA